MKLIPTPVPDPEPMGKVALVPEVAALAPRATGSSGASTRRVGLAMGVLDEALNRSMMPGADRDDTVVRKPPESTKAKPEGAPEADSRVPAGTSDSFISVLPTM